MVEEAALVLTSYEKTRGDVEETSRGPKGPFVVGTAAAGVRAASARETRKTLWRATSVLCLHARATPSLWYHPSCAKRTDERLIAAWTWLMGRALHSNSRRNATDEMRRDCSSREFRTRWVMRNSH